MVARKTSRPLSLFPEYLGSLYEAKQLTSLIKGDTNVQEKNGLLFMFSHVVFINKIHENNTEKQR